MRFFLLFWLILSPLAQAQQVSPKAVQEATQSVFRIIFLRPKADLVEVPLPTYEKELEGRFKKESFLGWWLRSVGDKCRKEKKEKCPLMVDLRVNERKELLLPIGSTALVGDGKTLYTAPHVWVAEYEYARRLGNAEAPRKEIEREARKTFLDREIDFVLFDEKRNIVLNTYDAKPAKIRDYSVGALLSYLYPKLAVEVTTDQMEFMILELPEALPAKYKPLVRAKDLADKKRPNGLVKEWDYGTSIYSVGMPEDPRFDLAAKKVKEEYRDLHVDLCKTSRVLIKGLEASPDIEKDKVAAYERYFFGAEAKEVFHGMSGGPILNEKGEFVSLNSTVQPVPTVFRIGPDGKLPTVNLIIGPHPAVLP